MRRSIRSAVALGCAVAALSATGSAMAALPATAGQYYFTTDAGGSVVPTGTTYTLASNSFAFTGESGQVYWKCASSVLSGQTDLEGTNAGLAVTGGTFSGCVLSGSTLTLTGSFSPAWQFTPTGGVQSPFTGEISNVALTLQCSSTSSARFTGTLSTGLEWEDAAAGSQLILGNASSLSKTATIGTGCPSIPETVNVAATYTLTAVGGSAVSPTNNLWLSYRG